MLTVNQNILVDFASKEAVHVTDFKYKQGEIDKSGINIDIASASITENTVLKVNWLYAADYDYVYVQNDGDYISSTKMKIYPPQNTLLPGLVAFEILLVEMSGETPLSQLKGPSVYIPVAEALIDDEEASMEDENIAAIISLINENDRLIGVVEQLDADVRAAEAVRDQNETNRNSTLDAKVSTVNSTVATANTAKTNADNAAANANTKAALANDKATLANTARDAANAAKTAADTAKSAADTATTNANNAATAANNAATAANTAATSANTAATNANNAATAANTAADRATAAITSSSAAVTEISQARVDMSGTTHASIGARMNSDFNTLASAVPKEIAVSGTETVVSNDTLSGEVSSAVLSGNTMVNLGGNMKYTTPTGTTDVGILTPKQQIKISTHYTVLLQLKKSNLPTETSYINFGSGFGGYLMFESSTTPLIFRHNTNETETLISLVKTKSVIDNDKYGSLKIPIYFNDIPKDFETEIDIIILEGDHTDKPLEFFEGLKSAELSEVTSHGVNLVDEIGVLNTPFYDAPSGYTGVILKLVKNKQYRVGAIFKKNITGCPRWFINMDRSAYTNVNRAYDIINENQASEVLTSDENGFLYLNSPWLGKEDLIKLFEYVSLYIYEVTNNTPTTYIPYQSSKTTLPEPITLRSLPNGVADTYDFDTQTLTRRCGEVVLNGSEGWTNYQTPTQNEAFLGFRAFDVGVLNDSSKLLVCSDKFTNFSGNALYSDTSREGVAQSGNGLHINITKSKLTTPDVAGFKAWLTQNPTKVVYQLATPTTEYIENNGQLRSYNSQTTVFANSIVPCGIKANIPINLKAWLESQNVTMAMLANDASIQAAMMEQIEEEQKVQSAEISSAQLALIDLYEMGL